MRIFLTGGTGFIGSHFLSLALKEGFQVRALRRNPMTVPVIKLPHEPEWIHGDLNMITIEHLGECQVVVHLASAGVSPQHASFEDMIQSNVVGSANLIAVTSAAGIKRMVVAGTCHEYGASALRYEAIPSDAPLEPKSLYGASKAAAYQLLATYARLHEMELFYGRLFNVYGEGQNCDNFWPLLCAAAKSGKDFPMTHGSQIRDFTPVAEVVAALLNACKRQDIQPGNPQIENIGTGKPQTLLEFALQEWQRLGASGSLLPGKLPARVDEIACYVPQVREALGNKGIKRSVRQEKRPLGWI